MPPKHFQQQDKDPLHNLTKATYNILQVRTGAGWDDTPSAYQAWQTAVTGEGDAQKTYDELQIARIRAELRELIFQDARNAFAASETPDQVQNAIHSQLQHISALLSGEDAKEKELPPDQNPLPHFQEKVLAIFRTHAHPQQQALLDYFQQEFISPAASGAPPQSQSLQALAALQQQRESELQLGIPPAMMRVIMAAAERVPEEKRSDFLQKQLQTAHSDGIVRMPVVNENDQVSEYTTDIRLKKAKTPDENDTMIAQTGWFPWSIKGTTPEDAKGLIQAMAAHGAKVVKLSGGYSAEQRLEALKEAHRQNCFGKVYFADLHEAAYKMKQIKELPETVTLQNLFKIKEEKGLHTNQELYNHLHSQPDANVPNSNTQRQFHTWLDALGPTHAFKLLGQVAAAGPPDQRHTVINQFLNHCPLSLREDLKTRLTDHKHQQFWMVPDAETQKHKGDAALQITDQDPYPDKKAEAASPSPSSQ